MRRNIWSAGERELEGEYGRVMAAGALKIIDSDINRCYAAGDLTILRSTLRKLRAAGDTKGEGVVIGDGKLAGDTAFTGPCRAENLMVCGDLSAQYLECVYLCGGSQNTASAGATPCFSGQLKATYFEALSPLRIAGSPEFSNVILSAPVTLDGEFSCDRFYALSHFSARAVNAEEIFILADSRTEISDLTGSVIRVETAFRPDKAFRNIARSSFSAVQGDGKLMRVENVEGDRVELACVRAGLVSGRDVVIGDLAVVDRVEYQNSLTVSDKAIVGEQVKI